MMSFFVVLVTVGTMAALFAWLKFVKQGPVFEGNVTLEGKTVLVTGGTSGIGKETAVTLAKLKARVIIASRNEQKGAEALFDIRSESGNNMVNFMKLDLSDFTDVRKFTKEFLATEPRLDILVNNAGVIKRGITKDGNDMILATNHLGPFLLTNLLLPLLKETATISPVRIVNVSSDGYRAGKINLENINLGLDDSCGLFQTIKQYCNSKLMNIYFTSELHRRLHADDPQGDRISTFSLHPGVISTKMTSYLTGSSIFFRLIQKPFRFFVERHPFYGCQTSLYCCLQEELESSSGCYFLNLKQRKLAAHATDAKIAEKLWKLSEKMTDL